MWGNTSPLAEEPTQDLASTHFLPRWLLRPWLSLPVWTEMDCPHDTMTKFRFADK